MNDQERKLSVYIHIPFCIRKCLYCDFLSAPSNQEAMKRYVQALCREIAEESESYVNYRVGTVFFGGGTPSILPGEQILQIMDTLRENYFVAEDCEITLEANPGTVTEEKLTLWKKAGINRLSIGLQSAIDGELKALGRIHDSKDFFETYELAVKSGFNNINIDLMSAIPGQTVQSLKETLRQVTELQPSPAHISAYSLIIEEGTPFYEHTPELPDDDTEREMYKITYDFLTGQGYRRYEISNYARPGYDCKHNQVYWRRGNYVGFGIGAASMIENVRFSNSRDLESYVNFYEQAAVKHPETKHRRGQREEECGAYIREAVQMLTEEEQMEEFMFLGLRMMEGVCEETFYQTFGKTIDQVYPGIVENFCNQKLLAGYQDEETGMHRISLTEYGIDVSNRVMAEFLLT